MRLVLGSRSWWLSFVLVVGSLGVAAAQPGAPRPERRPIRPAPPTRPTVAQQVNVTELFIRQPVTGFIDDVIATDDQRIAYVIANSTGMAELHVFSYVAKTELVVDLAPITLQPSSITLVGARAFVVGKGADGALLGALVELADRGKTKAGTAVYKLGPADDINVITRDGKSRVAVHKVTPTTDGTRHDVSLYAIETGRRVAAARPFELDANGRNAKVGFRVNHWSDGHTHAHGIKAGEWERKENQRAPDAEASYDLIGRKVYDRRRIVDLFEQRKRFQTLAEADRLTSFMKMAWDNSNVELWHRGKLQVVELDQSIQTYDPKSLQAVVLADGSGWLVLKVDPVNPAAVERKRADPEYLDVFRVGVDGKAIRKGRVLAQGMRHRFGVIGDRFWLLERLTGFERGGRRLTMFQPQ